MKTIYGELSQMTDHCLRILLATNEMANEEGKVYIGKNFEGVPAIEEYISENLESTPRQVLISLLENYLHE